MKLQSKLSLLGLFVASLFLIVNCSSPTSQVTPNGSPLSPSNGSTPVRLGFSAWPGWFPWQISQDEAIFSQNQVSVDLKWFDGYLESINTLTAGQLDANSQTLNDTISAVAGGADQVVVLVNDNSTGNDKIIVREGIRSIADLKGKKVAAEEGTVDHFLLLLGLQKAGLGSKDIQFQPLETGKAAAAFVAGQVDAVGVFAPFTTQALKRPGSRELFSSKDFPGAISDHLVFDRQFIQNHPDRVQSIVDSWFATLDFIQANPDKSTEIMAKRAGVTLEEYQGYAEGTKIFTLDDNLNAFQSGSDITSLDFAAKTIAQFLTDVGLVKTQPNLIQLFDDRFIKAYAAKVNKT